MAEDNVVTNDPELKEALADDDAVAEDPTPKAKPRTRKPKEIKAATPEGMKVVTAETDLRVVTDMHIVIFLEGGKPRTLSETLAYAAQGSGAKQKVKVTIED